MSICSKLLWNLLNVAHSHLSAYLSHWGPRINRFLDKCVEVREPHFEKHWVTKQNCLPAKGSHSFDDDNDHCSLHLCWKVCSFPQKIAWVGYSFICPCCEKAFSHQFWPQSGIQGVSSGKGPRNHLPLGGCKKCSLRAQSSEFKRLP